MADLQKMPLELAELIAKELGNNDLSDFLYVSEESRPSPSLRLHLPHVYDMRPLCRPLDLA